MKGATALVLVLTASAAMAELDRDTMRIELNGLPGMPSIIAGRFEVESKECLRQRIIRLEREWADLPVSTESAALSHAIELSERLATAHDEIGSPEEAKSVLGIAEEFLGNYRIAGDRALLASLKYRLLMMRGRVLTHVGVLNGDKAALATAQECFRRAFEITTPTPLGKEEVEAQLTDWMVDEKPEIAAFLDSLSEVDLVTFRNGMTGMMVTGEGWDNPDYLEVMRMAVVRERKNSTLGPTSVSYALRRRIAELLGEAKTTPIFGFEMGDPFLDNGAELDEPQRVLASRAYDELSGSGAEYRRRYTEWLSKGLAAGRHPDTDPKFWDGFEEAPLPRPEALEGKEPSEERGMQSALVGGGIGAFVAAMVVVYRRRKLGSQSVQSES